MFVHIHLDIFAQQMYVSMQLYNARNMAIILRSKMQLCDGCNSGDVLDRSRCWNPDQWPPISAAHLRMACGILSPWRYGSVDAVAMIQSIASNAEGGSSCWELWVLNSSNSSNSFGHGLCRWTDQLLTAIGWETLLHSSRASDEASWCSDEDTISSTCRVSAACWNVDVESSLFAEWTLHCLRCFCCLPGLVLSSVSNSDGGEFIRANDQMTGAALLSEFCSWV